MPDGRLRLAFIPPRYGSEVLGGAETLMRYFAERLVSRALADVEVLTTCATEVSHWQNSLPTGLFEENGVPVRRFPVDHSRLDRNHWQEINGRIMKGGRLSIAEEFDWVDAMPHAPELYAYLVDQGPRYDLCIFMPYLYGTTYYGAAVDFERSIIWPCLHDEEPAYLTPTRQILRRSRGIFFNTEPERNLAHKIVGRQEREAVVGIGMEAQQTNPTRFRQKYDLRESFLLYLGKIEKGKNVPLLVSMFMQHKRNFGQPVILVLAGPGTDTSWLPQDPQVRYLGPISEQDKWDGLAAALALVQPSVNESLSIVLLEAWLAGAPVLVNEYCAVTCQRVKESQGGLYFGDDVDFLAGVSLYLENEAVRRQLAANGRSFTEKVCSWDTVMTNFAEICRKWSSYVS